jgi:hypothetical protein
MKPVSTIKLPRLSVSSFGAVAVKDNIAVAHQDRSIMKLDVSSGTPQVSHLLHIMPHSIDSIHCLDDGTIVAVNQSMIMAFRMTATEFQLLWQIAAARGHAFIVSAKHEDKVRLIDSSRDGQTLVTAVSGKLTNPIPAPHCFGLISSGKELYATERPSPRSANLIHVDKSGQQTRVASNIEIVPIAVDSDKNIYYYDNNGDLSMRSKTADIPLPIQGVGWMVVQPNGKPCDYVAVARSGVYQVARGSTRRISNQVVQGITVLKDYSVLRSGGELQTCKNQDLSPASVGLDI